jgi:transcription elongation factor Elf1
MNEVQVFRVNCPYCGDKNMHTAIPDDVEGGKLLECSSCGKRFVVDFVLRIEVDAVYTLEAAT